MLEGSRLGGALLSRSVAPGLPAGFLIAAAEPGAWRKLLQELNEGLTESADITAATAAAVEVFGLFEQSGRHFLGRAQQ